jgi:hypothetical protein
MEDVEEDMIIFSVNHNITRDRIFGSTAFRPRDVWDTLAYSAVIFVSYRQLYLTRHALSEIN